MIRRSLAVLYQSTSQLSGANIRGGVTLDHVWLALAVVLLLLGPLLAPVPPNDFWWHMATGRIIATTGEIPQVDQFSYTRAEVPFYNQSWLAQLAMYGLHQLGGVPLLIVVHALVILLAYGLLLRLCTIRTHRLRLCVALLLFSLPVSFPDWNIRPQTYAFPLFVGFLTVLTEYRLGLRNRLWLLPPLMALWVNIHGTFVLGLALIGMTFVGELLRGRKTEDERRKTKDERPRPSSFALRPLLLWGALTAAALLLNPRGLGVLGYVRDLVGSNAVTSLVTEWAPPTIRDAPGVVFFVFVIACGALLTYARRRPDLTDALMFVAFLWLALGARRNGVWFGIAALPLVVTQAATLLPPARRSPAGSPAMNAALIGVLALLVPLSLPWIKPALALPAPIGALLTPDTPVQAVAALRQDPNRPERLFHTEGYGSYLIWAAPEQKVFIDPRIELYPYQQWVDAITLSQAIDVEPLLERYRFDGLLLDKLRQGPLAEAARRDPRWSVRYEDQQTLYLRRTP